MQLAAVCAYTLVISCVLSACSSSGPDLTLRVADNGDELASAYGADDGIGILEHVLFSNAESLSRITEVTNARRRDCMIAGGFVNYPVVNLPPAELLSPVQPIVRRLSLAEAGESGYRSVWGPTDPLDFVDPEVAFYESLGPAERSTFEQRTLECAPIVNDSVLSGDLAGFGENRLQLLAIQADLVSAFLASTDLEMIHDEWSVCMAEKGYQFSSPVDALEAARSVAVIDSVPSSQEKAQASADARCRQRTDLEDRVIDLFRDAEAVVVADNEVLIRELIRQSDAAQRLTP